MEDEDFDDEDFVDVEFVDEEDGKNEVVYLDEKK